MSPEIGNWGLTRSPIPAPAHPPPVIAAYAKVRVLPGRYKDPIKPESAGRMIVAEIPVKARAMLSEMSSGMNVARMFVDALSVQPIMYPLRRPKMSHNRPATSWKHPYEAQSVNTSSKEFPRTGGTGTCPSEQVTRADPLYILYRNVELLCDDRQENAVSRILAAYHIHRQPPAPPHGIFSRLSETHIESPEDQLSRSEDEQLPFGEKIILWRRSVVDSWIARYEYGWFGCRFGTDFCGGSRVHIYPDG